MFLADFTCDPHFFCKSGVIVCFSGNVASKKEIYHCVNHSQKHSTGAFTPKWIAFEPIKKGQKPSAKTAKFVSSIYDDLYRKYQFLEFGIHIDACHCMQLFGLKFYKMRTCVTY